MGDTVRLMRAEFLRLGQVHRNTFVEEPRVLAPDLSLRERPWLFLAGQIFNLQEHWPGGVML